MKYNQMIQTFSVINHNKMFTNQRSCRPYFSVVNNNASRQGVGLPTSGICNTGRNVQPGAMKISMHPYCSNSNNTKNWQGIIDPAQVQRMYKQPMTPLSAVDLRIDREARAHKDKFRGKSGIYMQLHKKSGHVYVGKGADLSQRPFHHFHKGGGSKRMQKYMEGNTIKERWANFYQVVLEVSPEEALGDLETWWFCHFDSNVIINSLFPLPSGVGISRHTPETIRKIKELARGRKGTQHTQELKDWLSKLYTGEGNPMFGKKHTPERKKKRVDNRKIRKWSAEQTEKQRLRHLGFNNYRSVGVRFTNQRDPSLVVEIGSLTLANKFLGYRGKKPLKGFMRLNPPVAHNKQKRRCDKPPKDQCWAIEQIPKSKDSSSGFLCSRPTRDLCLQRLRMFCSGNRLPCFSLLYSERSAQLRGLIAIWLILVISLF